MNFKQEYLTDIGHAGNHNPPYVNNQDAQNRIKRIYLTARLGQIDRRLCVSLWENHFLPLWNCRNTVPNTQQEFDVWIKNNIYQLSNALKQNQLLRLGIAQKMLNLFMKDLWAWDKLQQGIDKHLHFPLDRIILGKLSNCPKSWKAWTKVNVRINEFERVFGDYMRIQNAFRRRFFECNMESFTAPIEMEQFFWHRIRTP